MSEIDPPFAYGVRNVAVRLGVSESHVRNQVASGLLPSVRLGRRILIPASALDELLRRAGTS